MNHWTFDGDRRWTCNVVGESQSPRMVGYVIATFDALGNVAFSPHFTPGGDVALASAMPKATLSAAVQVIEGGPQ